MMTRRQYARKLFAGRIAYWIAMRLPNSLCPMWLIASAGFYAHDEGYESYVRRCGK
jgi:hypothetical protein